MYLPLTKPYLAGLEKKYLSESLSQPLSGNGAFSKKCEQWLETQIGCHKALLTPSATAALEMTALLIDTQPGDEIIMPSYTFVSTANAFALFGGVPVFVDVRSDTLNINETLIEKAITPKTKAIVAVHYAGVAAAMKPLQALSKKHGLFLIEDAAQAIGSEHHHQKLGSWGDLAAISFHSTKNIQCGEGGAILINKKNLAKKAEIIHEKGTNRSLFIRGEVNKYTWVSKGSSYLPSEMQAAYLLAQLQESENINAMRIKRWQNYHQTISALQNDTLFTLLQTPKSTKHNAHMYWMLFKRDALATDFFKGMRSQQIEVSRHYVPLHSSPAGRKYGRVSSSMLVTNKAGKNLIRLPLWPDMKKQDQESILKLIEKWCKKHQPKREI